MQVVILCGGLGTRLREETEYRPKPMVPIGGRPILWHIMKTYAHHGHKEFILCLGYKGEIIKENFSMVEAVYKMINIGLTVASLPLDEINMENSHVFFVVHNLFNEFRTELSFATYYFVNNMVAQT